MQLGILSCAKLRNVKLLLLFRSYCKEAKQLLNGCWLVPPFKWHKFHCQGKLCKWERSYRAVVAKAEGWFNNTIILLSSALVWHEITMTEWTNEWMKNLPDIYIDNSALWHQLQERCVVDVVRQVGHVNFRRFRLKKNQHKYGKYMF